MTQQDLADLYFNSIKVQLRRLSTALAGEQSVFQFHKGTIKTFDYKKAKEFKPISIP